jgi:phosphopantetheinyl transferase
VTVVEVQLVPVVAGAAEDALLLARLSDRDRESVRSLGFAADRDRAVTARAAARLELGRRLGMRPHAVPLLIPHGPRGRPVVQGTRIGVSWAHSGAWVALAFARERPVGVDLEQIPGRVELGALAAVGVRSLEEFVAHEAVGKATGEGLATRRPAAVHARPFEAPEGYHGAVAAFGHDWRLCLVPSPPTPPAIASAAAIGLWDLTGAGSRRAVAVG